MVQCSAEVIASMTEVYLARGSDGREASRRAMAAAFAARNIPAEAEVAKTVLGKPYLARYPGVQFNLSHSGPWGVCALSGAPVGVDVELPRPLKYDLARRFFTQAEQIYLAQRPQREFFRLWTRKESFIKALGKGLTLPLDRFSVLEDLLVWEGTAWYFQEFPLEEGYLTLCSQAPEARLHRLDGEAGQ